MNKLKSGYSFMKNCNIDYKTIFSYTITLFGIVYSTHIQKDLSSNVEKLDEKFNKMCVDLAVNSEKLEEKMDSIKDSVKWKSWF